MVLPKKRFRAVPVVVVSAFGALALNAGCGPWITTIPTYWDPIDRPVAPNGPVEQRVERTEAPPEVATVVIPKPSSPTKIRVPAPAPSIIRPVPNGPPPLCWGYTSGFDHATPRDETCMLRLKAAPVEKRSGCFVDEVVSHHVGVLRYPCSGGRATATFGDKEFFGEVRNGRLQLCIRTEFPFSDSCKWESAQQISGAIDDKALAYSYREQPAPGEVNCAGPCAAATTLTVMRTR